MGQSRSYHDTLSPPSSLPHQVPQANPQLHPTPIFQHHSLWKTWRGGPTVRSISVSRFTRTPVPDRLLLTSCTACVCYVCRLLCSQRQRTGAAEEALHEARQVLSPRWPLCPLPWKMAHMHDNVFPPHPRPPLHACTCTHATVMGLDQ